MWELKNRTPYAVDRAWSVDREGAHHWLVAVKATFDVSDDGRVALADEQVPIVHAPEFWGDPGISSLRYDADLVPVKPVTDVLIEGTVYAPGARPAASVGASIRFANVHKTLIAHGPRVYYAGDREALRTGPSKPFVSCPVRYEEAYGGSDRDDVDVAKQAYDDRNPSGRGVVRAGRDLHHIPAHRLEYPAGDVRKNGPAGFGPIASFWMPRRKLAGTYDASWEKEQKPLLPVDYDERFLQSAPRDQWPAQPLRGGEPILLSNLTPAGSLRIELPKIFLAFSSSFGGRVEEHRSRLGTVFVVLDTKKLLLVWHTSLRVRAPDVDYLDQTVITEKAYVS